MEPVNAIELLGVTKRFGEVVANDNVNLTVRKGEILSILGENGSGKTTLMNMLSGIYFPDEGEIRVNGKTVTIRSPKDSFELGIGMIHQHFKLINILTAAENIILGLPGKERLNLKQVEKEVSRILSEGQSGMLINAALGNAHSYVDFLVYDPPALDAIKTWAAAHAQLEVLELD